MKRHVVILAKEYFGAKSIYEMILDGTKTIESRWSMHECAPYQKVEPGDLLLLKESGRPVTACATAAKVAYYELTPSLVDELRLQYGKEIGAEDAAAWESTRDKRYGTLIWLADVHKITPIFVPRAHGAGWIIMDDDAGEARNP